MHARRAVYQLRHMVLSPSLSVKLSTCLPPKHLVDSPDAPRVLVVQIPELLNKEYKGKPDDLQELIAAFRPMKIRMFPHMSCSSKGTCLLQHHSPRYGAKVEDKAI